jgi:phosphonate transport system substrate-binding protein
MGFIFVALFAVSSCDNQSAESEWKSTGDAKERVSNLALTTFTIGDIDPDTPINRIRKIRPLADHLASELGWESPRVKIRIARSIDEIMTMLKESEVDLYIDSSYPSILASDKTGSRILLESLVDGARTYQSVIIALSSSDIKDIRQLGGSTIALQEEYSTSGHLLPTSLLLESGFKLLALDVAENNLPVDTMGYVYSGDEENTLSMIRKAVVPAGALSSQDFSQLPVEVMDEFVVLARSEKVPRKLASFREGLDESLVSELIEIMVAIDDADRLKMARNNGWNWQFEKLDEQSHKGIQVVREMIGHLEGQTR